MTTRITSNNISDSAITSAKFASGAISFTNSSLYTFPSGDYGSVTSSTKDAFDVVTDQNIDCMDPAGSVKTTDLGALT